MKHLVEAIMADIKSGYTELKEKESRSIVIKEHIKKALEKRKMKYDSEVIDVYPTCVKVEKEFFEFPINRAALEEAKKELAELGIDIIYYTF